MWTVRKHHLTVTKSQMTKNNGFVVSDQIPDFLFPLQVICVLGRWHVTKETSMKLQTGSKKLCRSIRYFAVSGKGAVLSSDSSYVTLFCVWCRITRMRGR